MEFLKIQIGERVLYQDREAVIVKIIDLQEVSIQEVKRNVFHTIKTSELSPLNSSKSITNDAPITTLTDKEWELAQKRYNIILPILNNRKNTQLIKKIAKQNNIHYTTIYRWLKTYDQNKVISALGISKKTGGKGLSRIDPDINEIVMEVIQKMYLNSSKKSINRIYREIEKVCKERELTPPHINTVRKRIKDLSEVDVIRSRYGHKAAHDKFEPIKGPFPGADYPLSVVQIDHTKVDLILVDEHYRKAFLRPWLTVAMDVYSRMVLGFYVSFDPPGEMGTGLCIANSILTKDIWMEKCDVEGEWPCWGIMKTIHVDNAKEFRGHMLRKACLNYGINLEFRPVGKPHWGGHVERLLGTFSKEIHNLPGTTFSNIKNRENYNSENNASLTISEFEKWLMTYIVNVYHKKLHNGIGMSPLQKFKEGVFSLENGRPRGLPPVLLNERQLKLDFMPYVERTVQEYGVVIDHITYYHDVLRKYIHAKETSSRNSLKKKFMFRRDPRDISTIYFYDPELNEYYEIPYRDTSKPSISIWEYKEVVRQLNKNNVTVDEDSIFNAYRDMEAIELEAIRKTKRLKRTSKYADKRSTITAEKFLNEVKETNSKTNLIDIKPFDELDDEAFT